MIVNQSPGLKHVFPKRLKLLRSLPRDACETCDTLPAQQLYNVESEIEETDYDSLEETSSVLSTEEWEDESDSWETDNGLTTEDDGHANASDTATPTPTPTASSPYIIPPAEGGRGQQSPSRAASAEETDEAVSSAASAAGRTIRRERWTRL